MDIPDILKVIIFEDYLKVAKKRPQDPRDLSIPFGKDRISIK